MFDRWYSTLSRSTQEGVSFVLFCLSVYLVLYAFGWVLTKDVFWFFNVGFVPRSVFGVAPLAMMVLGLFLPGAQDDL